MRGAARGGTWNATMGGGAVTMGGGAVTTFDAGEADTWVMLVTGASSTDSVVVLASDGAEEGGVVAPLASRGG